MPQSLSFNLTHIIFSTKDRYPFIEPKYRQDLYAYLAEIARNHNCECYRVGGVDDHVHLAIRLARTISVSDLVQELKRGSSKWFKSKSNLLSKFAWQRGHGSFSLSPKDLDSLIAYLTNEEKHHQKISFQDEYRKILSKYGMEWDERYVWD